MQPMGSASRNPTLIVENMKESCLAHPGVPDG